MHIEPGVRLGPYEIVAPIGAGGMGEVYRARDTRLERSVAIKILPAAFAHDERLKLRFEREAKAISTLSHPNICTLFDVGHDNGTDYLVMELIDGETLAERLGRGPLPLSEALKIAVEIAGALDKAHKHGIVHRDLKPGNVMLTKGGAKLLDFGLAKAQDTGLGPQASGDATQQKPITEQGRIVGTFQYMAPEQLEGEEADARTDIFAFGAVLYEMVTGRRAFTGKSKTSLIAAIVSAEPAPIAELQPMTPSALERLIRVCLAKEPDDRWQTARDLQLELQWIAESGSQGSLAGPAAEGRRTSRRWAWTVAVALCLLTAGGWLVALREMREPARVVRSWLLAPDDATFAFDRGAMTLSADGRTIAYIARTADESRLFVQSLDTLTAQQLSGTSRASYPFWSPDGRSLGFFSDGKLRKVSIAGGPSQTLADTGVGRGGTWNREGLILFSPDARAAIFAVSAGGGPTRPMTTLDKLESTHRWPHFLPDGRHFLYVAQTTPGSISLSGDALYVASIDEPSRRKFLLHASSNVAYAEPGYLLFHRDRILMAQRFDPDKLEVTGDPFPIAEDVQFVASSGSAIFSVADDGTLVYQTGAGGGLSHLTWFDALGNASESVGGAADFQRPRLSPDGRRVAVDVIDPSSGNVDLWIYDLARRTASRFTFDPAVDVHPTWSPDGQRIVFTSTRKGPSELYEKITSGGGTEQLLFDCRRFCVPTNWSSDGRTIHFQVNDPKTKWDLWTLSVPEKRAVPLVVTEFNELNACFSPDGRWFAYTSDETGRNEVYVQSFPPGSGRWQISNAGGGQAVWSSDGKEIFFASLDESLMAVSVRTEPQFEADLPRRLFPMRMKGVPGRRYDVAPDKKRFLVNTPAGDERVQPVVLVLNWAANHPVR